MASANCPNCVTLCHTDTAGGAIAPAAGTGGTPMCLQKNNQEGCNTWQTACFLQYRIDVK